MRTPGRRAGKISAWLISVLLACGLLGAYFTKLTTRPAVTNLPSLGIAISSQSPEAAQAFSRLTGVYPRVVAYYVSFGSPLRSVAAFQQAGVLPLVQLDPSHTSVAAIAAGQYDAYLTSIAAEVRDSRKPVALSFGHEMNGTWYSWGAGHTRPADFVAAWRRIHGIFQAAKTRNVTWVWAVDDVNPQTIREWWPGAAYVNWVGVDGYYWTPSERFAQIEGPTIRSLRSFTQDPLILTEVAVYPNPQSAAQVRDLFRSAAAYHVEAFVWFNQDRERAWSLQGDPAALAAFKAAAQNWPGGSGGGQAERPAREATGPVSQGVGNLLQLLRSRSVRM
jgi:mannan endo-1,4-beta-mannosidase